MALTVTEIKAAKASAKSFKMYDGQGLYLEVAPSGGKWWRFKYMFAGKEKRISLGTYPEISLSDARERRDAARKQVAKGIDPSAAKQAEKQARGGRKVLKRLPVNGTPSICIPGRPNMVRRL